MTDILATELEPIVIKNVKRREFTKRQQKFIQLYVYQDLSNTECAHRAGYAHPGSTSTLILNHPKYLHVQDRIRDLQEGEQKRYEITFEKVARDLRVIRDAAVEDGSYGAAVQAELGRAKLAGLMVEKKEVRHGRIDQMDRAEVETRLRNLIESKQLTPAIEAQYELKDSELVESGEEVLESEMLESEMLESEVLEDDSELFADIDAPEEDDALEENLPRL